MWSLFHGWIDYYRVAFSIELLELGFHLFGYLAKENSSHGVSWDANYLG